MLQEGLIAVFLRMFCNYLSPHLSYPSPTLSRDCSHTYQDYNLSLHIAIATINDLDYIFSYNFQHLSRDKTKKMTSVINFREGYKPITIASVSEVVEHGDNE